MNRRDFIGLATIALAQASGGVQAQTGGPATAGLRVAARNAWLWGLPLIEMAQQRSARAVEGVKVNSFQHQRALVGAKDQFVTTPNNDTLYSQAWINLESGPVSLSIGPSGGRYYCLPFMDMYSNNFAIIGSRTAGDGARSFSLVGPNHPSNDPAAIRAPTNWVWLLGRVLVDGDADLPNAHKLQDSWTVKGPSVASPKSHARRSSPWNEYFDSVQQLMNESPPPLTDARMIDSIAPLVRLGSVFDAARFSPEQVAEIKAGIGDAANAMVDVRKRTAVRNGWSMPLHGLGDFGQEYEYRAAVAIGGLGALPRVEAMYLRNASPDGRRFDSARNWTLTFTADQLPPVDSFWSLSMYRLTSDGQLFFAGNQINRYAIGDRTPGLKRGPDGSLSLWMSREAPTGPQPSNWLPSPAEGKFVLILRAYLPKSDLIEARYMPPAVQGA